MHLRKRQVHFITVLAFLSAAARSWVAGYESADYLREIKPVLQARCYACHGALKQQAGLRLDTAERLRAGGKNGLVVVPGKPEESRLLARLNSGDPHERMPLDAAPLKAEQIEAIRFWIASGAPIPADERGEDDPRSHWSFQRLERPELPGGAPGENPVDAFLAAAWVDRSLKPQPEAERGILLRRLYLDLVGLPPTEAQRNDSRPYEVIVDELLTSPQHGERWARHWLDVWRYSDWYGLGDQLRNSQKHLWHWRDWVVESLNADKGYDRMIREMLAADELAPEDPDTLRATGFLARNYYLFNRTTWLDDTIEHTGKAFLGLTLNCAKCHDHKYDPIDQVDYYNFRAIFEPHQVRLDPIPGVTDFEKDGLPRVFDNHPETPTFFHLRGDPSHPDKAVKISPAVPALFAGFAPPLEPVSLPLAAWAPASQEFVRNDRLAAAHAKLTAAKKELSSNTEAGAVRIREAKVSLAEAELAYLEAVIAADTAALSQSDEGLAKIASHREGEVMLARANLERFIHEKSGDEKKQKAAAADLTAAEKKLAANDAVYTPLYGAKKALETPEHTDTTYPATYPSASTGRRLMLARWITSRENPLTARVAVNQVWMRHFGEPLVETVFDFGRQAKRPEHAELLDYLAVEFIESGWSFRHLHRLLVTSAAYRRSSSNAGADPATLAADPANHLYWRAHPRRMESQVLRDSILHLAGTLDLTVGGPSLDPKKPSFRRSLYFTQSRDDQDKFLSMFDDADILQCYRRPESIVPQQALALANSAVSIGMAEKIAARLPRSGVDQDLFLEAAFKSLIGRSPDAAELLECKGFCREMAELETVTAAKDPEGLVRSRLVHALLNHNDFVTVR